MSPAILNVAIDHLCDSCAVADAGLAIRRDWTVAVIQCDGHVINWPHGRYRLDRDLPWVSIPLHKPAGNIMEGWWYDRIPTRNEHVDIEVPYGCYTVVAAMGTWFADGELHGNWVTDRALVQAAMDVEVPVKLYASAMQPCPSLVRKAVRIAVQNGGITEETGRVVIETIAALAQESKFSVPRTAFAS